MKEDEYKFTKRGKMGQPEVPNSATPEGKKPRDTSTITCAVITILAAILILVVALAAVYAPWSPFAKNRAFEKWYESAQEKANAGDPESQLFLGMYYMRYEGRKADGLALIRKVAEQDNVEAMNALAWILCTEAEDFYRDGEKALELAKRVCEEDKWETYAYIDTLAAAYAEMEDWDKAVETQKLAIEKSPSFERERLGLLTRLNNFENKEKYRERCDVPQPRPAG